MLRYLHCTSTCVAHSVHIPYPLIKAFQIAAALAQTTAQITTFRLLGGIFSSASHPVAPYDLRPLLPLLMNADVLFLGL